MVNMYTYIHITAVKLSEIYIKNSYRMPIEALNSLNRLHRSKWAMFFRAMFIYHRETIELIMEKYYIYNLNSLGLISMTSMYIYMNKR